MRQPYVIIGLTVSVLLGVFFNQISAPISLAIGLAIGITGMYKNRSIPFHSGLQKNFLKISIVGLGFGINLDTAVKVGKESFSISLLGVMLTFLLAIGFYAVIKSNKRITFLIASGTAICGGSAIAAVSPGVKATTSETSIALAVVFLLNSVALLLFPPIGYLLDLSQNQFGTWCAIAIHDTSSVIGASNSYGQEALLVATTTKLVRALWIIPLVLVVSIKSAKFNIKDFPYFILGFIVAICINSFVTGFEDIASILVWISKRLLVFTLFLIGIGINLEQIKKLGGKTFLVGVGIWVLLSILSLLYVRHFVV